MWEALLSPFPLHGFAQGVAHAADSTVTGTVNLEEVWAGDGLHKDKLSASSTSVFPSQMFHTLIKVTRVTATRSI